MKQILAMLALTACAAPANCPPVSALDAVETRYLATVAAIKASGACESYTPRSSCPAYQQAKADRDAASVRWQRCAP